MGILRKMTVRSSGHVLSTNSTRIRAGKVPAGRSMA
jgi:hypothetical protein